MNNCVYELKDELYVCIKCGDKRKKIVNRNCRVLIRTEKVIEDCTSCGRESFIETIVSSIISYVKPN